MILPRIDSVWLIIDHLLDDGQPWGGVPRAIVPHAEAERRECRRRLFFHGPPGNPVRYDVALAWLDLGMISMEGAGRSLVEIVDARRVTVAIHVVEC